MNKQERFTKTNQLSVILSMALDDFELINKDPNYEINMSTWHYQKGELELCEVCLAGSLLAKTFKFPISEDTMDKLKAINSIRWGDLVQALHELGLTKEQEAINEITNITKQSKFYAVELILGESIYSFDALRDCKDFKDFVTFYRRIASKLNAVGL